MGGQSLGFLMWYPPKLQWHALIHNRFMSFTLDQSMLPYFQRSIRFRVHELGCEFSCWILNLAVCWECYCLIQLWELQSIVSLRMLNRLFYPSNIFHIKEFSITIVCERTKSTTDWFLCFLLDLRLYVCLFLSISRAESSCLCDS